MNEQPPRAADGGLDSINEHLNQVETMVHPSCKTSEECCCCGRVLTACQNEGRFICNRSGRKTGVDPVTGPATAMQTDETSGLMIPFLLLFIIN